MPTNALASWLCVLLASAALAADPQPLDDARELLLTGKYAEAKDAYAKLASVHPRAAALGTARAQHAVGERTTAEKTLRDALAHDEAGEVQAELAILLFERGALDEAETTAQAVLKAHPNQLAARWLMAELHQARGRMKAAADAYEWLVDYQNEHDNLTAEQLHYVGRAAAQYARWNRNSGQFKILVNDLYPQALEKEEHFWPAHLETAQLFLEKYNESAATNALQKGLAINPNAAELHVVRAALALQKFDTKNAKVALDRALSINPKHLTAQQLQADLQLADQRADLALPLLEAARELNPVAEETLARIAACYLVIDGPAAAADDSRASKLIAEVIARNEHCGRFFAALGDTFDLMRKYPQAAQYYQQTLDRMPQLIYVRGQLGMCQMRLGEETTAAPLLEASFAEDPFNVRVKNMLEVLDVLQGYAVLETDHFVLKFDRGQDELLAKFMARYLEDEVYPEIVATLGYEPEGKSLFEVFNRAKNTRGHGWFSARMVGLPFIGTVGACGGKIVAMASPNDMPQKFHWGRVLKHEFVHVVNLQQTDFNIPHWFTEGIAVRLEHMPRPTSWNELLAQRLADDTLFDLSDINFGFLRPASSDDWTLAYCQAELYCDYLVHAHGDDALAKMLQAYRQNLTTAEALKRKFGVPIKHFEADYLSFVKEQLRDAGYSPKATKAKELSLEELTAAVEKSPDDADLQAQLALAHLNAGQAGYARKAALAAHAIDAKLPLASYVLARLQVAIGDHEAARKLLAAVHNPDQPDERVVALLASIDFQAADYASAEQLYKLGHKHFAPRDKWLKALAKLYLKTGADPQLAPVLVQLAELEYDNATLRKKLAQMAIAREDWTEAERWAKDALFIDLADASVHAQLGQARVNLQKLPAAIEAYETAIELDPEQPAWRFALADAHLAAGQKDAARRVLTKLLEVAPDFPGADVMLEQLTP